MTEKRYQLLKIKQWLSSWDDAKWTPDEGLGRPPAHFYMGSMPIKELRKIAGIDRRLLSERKAAGGKSGYQRLHEADRSAKIARYIELGYPLSTQKGLDPSDHRELIHPGWLPTAILVNILREDEERRRGGMKLRVEPGTAARVVVKKEDETIWLVVPEHKEATSRALEPLEIIDGQHRIFAVGDDLELQGDFEVPVVFFKGLSTAWQAYLFWVINVEPKKINPSLAFDLYPELRSQSWLDRTDNIKIYHEHRSQEITDILWRYERSPWKDRIELLGNRVDGHVSNAAYIRTIASTFIRRWGSTDRIGGLYGATDTQGKERVLRWNRAQQAAFVVLIWRSLADTIKDSKASWVEACRVAYNELPHDQQQKINPRKLDPAFAGPYTLLATDQGVRAVLFVFNAVAQCAYEEAGLEEWEVEAEVDTASTDEVMDEVCEDLDEQKRIVSFVSAISKSLVQEDFDWRTSSEPQLKRSDPDGALRQAAYRGSSGYKALSLGALKCVESSELKYVADAAKQAISLLGWS